MLYPIGIIPYINMEPYRQLGAPEFCKFISLVPKNSVKAIELGFIIAAAIPVGGLFYLSKLVEPIGQFGIAAKKCSMSVLFFSKIPFTSIGKEHKIWLTSESSSSVRLLYLLLGYKNGFSNMPKLSSREGTSDGELIIGDKALIRKDNKSWPYITDLAQMWYDIKGCSFVFARWVIRKDVPVIVKDSINSWLYAFKEQEKELVEKAVKVGVKALNITNHDMKLYFKIIKRTLDKDDLIAQQLFMDSFKKYRKDPLF